MFTGIVTATGRVSARKGGNLTLKVPFSTDDVAIGASVSCSGVCLTVTAKTADTLDFDVSEETLNRTTIGSWDEGREINLERSLKAGDELGGHMVMGHVDAVAGVVAREPLEGAEKLTFNLPARIAHLVAEKGSVAIDGVSLTVNGVGNKTFDVAIIPHTGDVTTLKSLKKGDKVNMEADVFARYSARLMDVKG